MTTLRARLSPARRLRDLRREFDRAVLVLALGDLVSSFGFSLVFPFLTIYLTAELGASAAEAGIVLGLYSVVSIGSNALGGWLADRVGRKPVMVVSITCTAVLIAAMGLVRDVGWVAALTLLFGFVDPPFVPAARAAVADVVPSERRPRAYGLISVAASIGWIIGPSVGAGLSVLGYGFLFVTAGVIIAAYTVILVVGFRETRPVDGMPGRAGDDGAIAPATAAAATMPSVLAPPSPAAATMPSVLAPPPAAAAATPPAAAAATPPAAGHPAPSLVRPFDPRRVFAAYLLLAVAIHGALFVWVAILPIYAHADLGVSTATWGLLFALNGVMILLLQMRISTAAERRSRPRFMAIGAALSAGGYLVVALLPGTAFVMPLLATTIVLITFGEMCVFPVEPSFVSDLSPTARRGRYQGLAGAAAGLGTAIAPALGGIALDVAPGPAVWLGTAAVCATVAAGLWWLGAHVSEPGDVVASV